MVFLSGFSLLVGMIGLYILLFVSFTTKDELQAKKAFMNKETRKIRVHQENSEHDKYKPKKPSPQFIMLLQTIIIGELVGLFFLILSHSQMRFTILIINAGLLLLASFGCSVLTLFNVWLKKKMNMISRTILQIATLILGIVLMKLSIKDKVAIPSLFFIMPIYLYYGTVVIALVTMLINVIFGNKMKKVEFNFSNYLLLVIVSGLVIGTGLMFSSSF